MNDIAPKERRFSSIIWAAASSSWITRLPCMAELVAEAVLRLHSEGIVHKRLSPDTIFVNNEGTPNVDLTVLKTDNEPVTNTYTQNGKTTYLVNENSFQLRLHADQAVTSELLVNNAEVGTPGGSDDSQQQTGGQVDQMLQNIWKRLIEQEQDVEFITSAELTANQESRVKIRDRAVLRIPAQPLQGRVGLGVGAVRSPQKYEYGGLKVIGDIYEFKFDPPTTLQKPAELMVRFNLEELPDPNRAAIYWYNEQMKRWEYVGVRLDLITGTITAQLPHFSKFALLYNADLPLFADMHNRWSQDQVYRLASIGAVNGVQSGNALAFGPERAITRQEFAKISVGIASAASVAATGELSADFADRDEVAAWAKPYLAAAINHRWLGGTERDGQLHLDPSVPITRAEAIAIIGRMLEGKSIGESRGASLSFSDEADIPDWAKPYVDKLVKLGVINGYPDGTLHPDAEISREEAAAIISHMLDVR